jgi:serine/threonine protein kinase
MNPMTAYEPIAPRTGGGTVTNDPLVGAVLDGRYQVETMIATGGMSAVYRGLDRRLDRPVALKVMDARYAGDQQFLTRFQLEARAIARLKDPGLVAVYDQGTDGQHPFLVMELVEGGTLRELLRERGPMPPHAVAAVLGPVLGGLAVAHRAGLVHRDVKPENVLISDDGDVKIADFGLVRAVAEAGITSASVILGTAAYLSPEQVGTGTAGPRSDVYAVGILAFELLTGVTPSAIPRHGTRTRSTWGSNWTRSLTNWRCPRSGCPHRATPPSTRRRRCTTASSTNNTPPTRNRSEPSPPGSRRPVSTPGN